MYRSLFLHCKHIACLSATCVLLLPLLASAGRAQSSGAPTPESGALPAGALRRLGTVQFRHWKSIHGIAYSPDGKSLATCSSDGTIRVWDANDGRERARVRLHDAKPAAYVWPNHVEVFAICFAPEGKAIFAGDGAGVWVWNWKSNEVPELRFATEKIKQLPPAPPMQPPVQSVAVSPNGKMIAWDDFWGTVRVHELATGREVLRMRRRGFPLISLCADTPFSRDGKYIAFSRDDGTICIWDLAAGKETASLTGHRGRVTALCTSSVGAVLASSAMDGEICYWDMATGKLLRALQPEKRVATMTFSPDGKMVAAASGLGTIELRSAPAGERIRPMQMRMPTGIGRLIFSPDGKKLVAVGEVQAVRHWEVSTGAEIGADNGHLGDVLCLAWSADGRLASSGLDRCVRIWNSATGRTHAVGTMHTRRITSVQFSPDVRTIATGAYDSIISLLDGASGKTVATVRAEAGGFRTVGFCQNGKSIAAWSLDGVRIWDASSRKLLWKSATDNSEGGFACSPDGTRMCVALTSGLTFWDTGRRQVVRRFGGEVWASSLAYSPDGGVIAAVGAFDPRVRLFEVASGTLIDQLNLGDGQCTCLGFVGDALALGRNDGSIELRDWLYGETCRTLRSASGSVESLAWHSASAILASGHANTTILLWKLAKTDLRVSSKAADLGETTIEKRWARLKASNAREAFAAIKLFAGGGKATVDFLGKRVQAVLGPDVQELRRLVAGLSNDDYNTREHAMADLAKLGSLANDALNERLQNDPSAEETRRIHTLLDAAEKCSPEELRQLRSIRILERIGGQQALAVLRMLGTGVAASPVTNEARAAAMRLTQYRK